ncbi:MAG: Dolichyl-phosphate-mannose-protein mannosyltransferase [Chloroflexia bacterium]|jgi:hypothetical protein|nr:Dolichyl-phosphate-mannose-protein mannosyltransferase [Chloroflexia bacterium]
MTSQRALGIAWRWGPPVLLIALSSALFAYLLARFPYNGLYGQDAYAYFYQAEALWRELTGQPQPPFALFSANGLYWPVGYHLHLLPGFFLGWPEAGRVLTLALAALTPAVLYKVVGELWHTATTWERTFAGLVSGAVLLLTGTYTRTGLSLMSDVPAVFWGVLSIYCCLRAWPPLERAEGRRAGNLWALGAGLSLGLAVLVRYSSALLVPAVSLYVAARLYSYRKHQLLQEAKGIQRLWQPALLLALVGVAVALSPQVAYALAHDPGPALRAWSVENLFSKTVTGPDGTSTFSQPMIVFYLLSTLANVGTGFLSPFYLLSLALGIWLLVRQSDLAVLLLLFPWWFISVLAYSGTTYQAHRFALTFMPALALLIGVGTSFVASRLREEVLRRRTVGGIQWGRTTTAATLVLACVGIGLVQGWRSVEQWAATHSAFNEQEQQVVGLARGTVAATGEQGTPRAVSFGFSAPLYHYTHWPILDFFLHDEADIQQFLAAPEPHILVLPEESMSTQWAGTPSAARWQWIQRNYKLTLQGTSGAFTVYRIDRR